MTTQDRTNQERANNAQVAIDAYAQLPITDGESCVSDLLCDLMHLCHQQGTNFKRAYASAKMNFKAEV